MLIALLLMVGCALWRPHLPTGSLRPQSLGDFTESVRLRQRLTIEAGPRVVSFPVIFEATRDRATFNVLSPVGTRILTVQQTHAAVSVESAPKEEFPMDPRRLYLGVQLMLWPRLRLKDPYTVRQVVTSDGNLVRRLLRSERRFATIKAPSFSSYNGKRTLTFSEAPYTLHLVTRHVTTPGVVR